MSKLSNAFLTVLLLAAVLLVPAVPSMGQVGPDALKYCEDFAFSTEEDFITQGPEPPDGNPVISDGDLLQAGNGVVRPNQNLVGCFEPTADFLGIRSYQRGRCHIDSGHSCRLQYCKRSDRHCALPAHS